MRGDILLTIALPFSHGLSKSELGLLFGLGACSQLRAIFSSISKSPDFCVPRERDVEIRYELMGLRYIDVRASDSR